MLKVVELLSQCKLFLSLIALRIADSNWVCLDFEFHGGGSPQNLQGMHRDIFWEPGM